MSDIIKTQQGLARKAETDRRHHFEDLYHLLCKREWIEEALRHVLDNDGAGTAGVDGMSWRDFNDVDKSDFENEKYRQQFIRHIAGGTQEPHVQTDARETGRDTQARDEQEAAFRNTDMGCTLPIFPGTVRNSMGSPPGRSGAPIHHHDSSLSHSPRSCESDGASRSVSRACAGP